MIDIYMARMLDECRREKYLEIDLCGQDLFLNIRSYIHTIGPRIPNIPHTPEECSLLIIKKIEEAITSKLLSGSIDVKSMRFHIG